MFSRGMEILQNTGKHCNRVNILIYFNDFQYSAVFLYPLKTSENIWVSDVFRGFRDAAEFWKAEH